MKKFRSVIFWCHLVAGLLAGSVIFIMSLTGAALAYEKQIITLVDGKPPQREAPSRPSQPDLTAEQRRKLVEERERKMTPVQKVFRKITTVHRWLGAPRDTMSQRVARAITGAANVIFLFIVVSGFYLWWPRKWSRAALKAVTVFNPQLSGKARNFNWHNVIGFWIAPFLFLIVFTGVFISYKLSSHLPPEMRRVVRFTHTGEIAGIGGQTVAFIASLGAALLVWTGVALALRRFQTWRSKTSSPTSRAQ